MFTISQNPSYTAPVNVELPGDKGKVKTVVFTARFKRISQTEIESLNARLAEQVLSDTQLIDEVLLGWEGVQDSDGSNLEFNPDNLAALLDIYPVRPSMVKAFFDSLSGAKAKN